MRAGRLLLTLSILLSCELAHAEGLKHEPQVWTPISGQADLVEGTFGAYLEVQPRIGEDGLDRLLVRPAAYLRLSPVISVWLGYAFAPEFEPEYREEHRIWQQFLADFRLDDDAARLVMALRTRLEQRFIEDTPHVSVRVRQMLRLQLPVYEIVSAVAWDELFVNLNDVPRGPRLGYDQNRVFVGVNLGFLEEVSLDVGYMNVHLNNQGPGDDRMLHVAVAWLYFKF